MKLLKSSKVARAHFHSHTRFDIDKCDSTNTMKSLSLVIWIGMGISLMLSGLLIVPTMTQSTLATTAAAPSLILPNLKPDKSVLMDHDLVKDPQTGQILLRFSNGIGNYGEGTLMIFGNRTTVDLNNNSMPAYQRLYKTDGSYVDFPVGRLVYHPVHHHYHFVGAVTYSLLDSSGNVIITAPKISFCLADVAVVNSTLQNYPKAPVFNSCYSSQEAKYVKMGISPGWEDIYSKDQFGQAFNVSTLMQNPHKQTYYLQSTTNPDGLLIDSNNGHSQTTSVPVDIWSGASVGTGILRPGV